MCLDDRLIFMVIVLYRHHLKLNTIALETYLNNYIKEMYNKEKNIWMCWKHDF